MKYDTANFPKTAAACEDFKIAEWENEDDGYPGSYDEREFDSYRLEAVSRAEELTRTAWTTDMDETGVYLTPDSGITCVDCGRDVARGDSYCEDCVE